MFNRYSGLVYMRSYEYTGITPLSIGYTHLTTLHFCIGSSGWLPINFAPQTRDKKCIICRRITQ